MAASHLIVLSTVGDPAVAAGIATTLVEERLAACVNVLPAVASTYRWEGKVRAGQEVLLVMKTVADRYPALEARLRALHPDALPEVVALPIDRASAPYLDWITENTRP